MNSEISNGLSDSERVEQLKNFPFESFETFQRAWKDKRALLNFNTKTAHEFGFRNKNVPKSIRACIIVSEQALTWLPIGYALYTAIKGEWYSLMALPVLIIALFLFNQDTPKFIRWALLVATFAFIWWSISASQTTMTVLGVALFVIWMAQKIVHDLSLKILTIAASIDQELTCTLWKNNDMFLTLNNGNRYASYWKLEGGEKIYYEPEKVAMHEYLEKRQKTFHHL